MHLISVQAILAIEQGNINPAVKVIQNFNDTKLRCTKYAILSHCWGEEEEEVLLKEMLGLVKMGNEDRAEIQQRSGYQKIVKTCEQARRDGFEWAWVDTCCIDTESSAELSEAINSMYRWYKNAATCYVYLHDVQDTALPKQTLKQFKHSDGRPKWFSRGWTLQELIAPIEVLFFNRHWESLGQKSQLAPVLSSITGIPMVILQYGLESNRPCAAQVMSWAANRTTTREEDQAYSLLGLFGIYMPMLYGEGKSAFRRLQLEILRTTNDHSIFSWHASGRHNSALADNPHCFRYCHDTVRMDAEEYREMIKQMIPEDEFQSITEEQLRTCSVTNGGIQIWLPVRQKVDLPIFEATLACRNEQGPRSIELALCKSQYYKCPLHVNDLVSDKSKFQQMFLAYSDEIERSRAVFKVESSYLSQDGFVQEGKRGNSVHYVTLGTNEYRYISYYNQSTDTHFGVTLGYFLGEPWAHPAFPSAGFCPKPAMPSQVSALHFAAVSKSRNAYCLIKHLHLPDTLSGIQLTYQRLPQPKCHLITLAVTPCSGQGCPSNSIWQAFDSIPVGDKGIFSHFRTIFPKAPQSTLLIDGTPTAFAVTPEDPGFELGDYGLWNNGRFEPQGNIFNYLDDPGFSPVKQVITDQLGDVDEVRVYIDDSILFLRNPLGLSIPDKCIQELSRTSLIDFKGRHLISTVVQCSRCTLECGFRVREGKLPVSTPLCIVTQPLVWYEEGAKTELE